MTREQVKELLPAIKDFDNRTGKKLLPIIKIMEAFAEGKDIQFKICDEWEDLENPVFIGNAKDYRIKPSSVKSNQSNNQNSIFQNKI